ncbi:MAG: hypothetical protein II816_02780 [Elusimicrobia bacterium]|nr:hypothetical protein [Elusimicrobiota bacterium]
MINKKLLLSFLIFVSFSAMLICADKNFFTIMNGSDSRTVELSKSSAFVGQSAAYSTKEGSDVVSMSAFASIIKSPSNTNISFENQTEASSVPSSEISVPLKVIIRTTTGNIDKITYRIWQGEDVNFDDWTTSPEITYTGFSPASEVTFNPTVTFDKGKVVNFFRVYARDTSGSGGMWSADYTVKLDSSLSDVVTFTAPDRLTKLATIDPNVETTGFSIDLSVVTVSMFEGNFASGTPLYEVIVSTNTSITPVAIKNVMYDTDKGKISFVYSDFIKVYNEVEGTSLPTNLTNSKTYTLKIVTAGQEDEPDILTFKALSGGVADVLTYPSPFNPKKEKVKIRYLLAKDAVVTIKIYDKAGKFVSKVIQSEYRSAGTNEDEWDGRNYAGNYLATGPYICEVIAKGSNGENRRYTALALVN